MQIFTLLFVISSLVVSVKGQEVRNPFVKCEFLTDYTSKEDTVYVSSKELKRRTVFINDLYVPSTAGLTRIRDKTVFINILVNSKGSVIMAKSTRGHPLLRAVGVSITNNAKFLPIEIDNKPVNMCGKLVLNWIPPK